MGIEVQSPQQQELRENPNNNSGFLPPSLVSDEIADTIKVVFHWELQVRTILLAGFSGSSARWEHHHQHPAEIERFRRLFPGVIVVLLLIVPVTALLAGPFLTFFGP
ncbi:hypothetical protein Goshw_006236 [Gossypium schwendimanii]|uniref:Uncharacterized protein n=1 Tax=Gossypium schwendimanii TaxID=34291 RepID=A0A7J9L861_GOSSC|nr:hypothetical protein [Gossypium schwendimanii]